MQAANEGLGRLVLKRLARLAYHLPRTYFYARLLFDLARLFCAFRPVGPRRRIGRDRESVETARQHYLSAHSSSRADDPSFGNRWQYYKEEMRELITAFENAEQVIFYAQRKSAFDHRVSHSLNAINEISTSERVLHYDYGQRQNDELAMLQDSDVSLAYSVVNYRGRKVSNIFFFHLSYLLSLRSVFGKIKTICEIGGGYGDMARLAMTLSDGGADKYFIVDLPETLFFAEVFLRLSRSRYDVVYLTEELVSQAATATSPTVFLVPIARRHLLNDIDIDVVVNMCSMGEMSDDWVETWRSWIEGLRCSHFYSLNYFGNPVNRIFEGRATMAPRVSDQWDHVFHRGTPPIHFVQSTERRWAESVFRRAAAGDREERAARGRHRLVSYFDLCDGRKIGQHEYIQGAYLVSQFGTENDILRFINLARDGLGYMPVECYGIMLDARRRLRDRASFANEALEEFYLSAKTQFEQGYPRGVVDV